MHIIHAVHPTDPGTVIQIFHSRTAAESYAKPLLQEIGNALIKRHDDLHAEPHPKADAWEAFKLNIGAPFVAWSTFVDGLDDRDEEDRDWFVEISERTPRDEREHAEQVNETIGEELEGGGASLSPWSGYPRLMLRGKPLHIYGAREEVQPLDPADLVVSTLVGNLASIAAQLRCDEQGPELAEAVERVAGEAEKAIEAGQAWLDKARPVGRIADDVVRLAGIIVAGTDLHACLSEAMDVHIYDADQGEAPDADCGYTAALKGWTDALAGITVTTPAPAREEIVKGQGFTLPELVPFPLRYVEDQTSAYIADAAGNGTGIVIWSPDGSAKELLKFAADAMNAAAVHDVPEIAVILEGGTVQNVVARNDEPVIVHIVDYETEGGDETDIVQIPQGEGKTAGAFLQRYDGKLDRNGSAQFWSALAL